MLNLTHELQEALTASASGEPRQAFIIPDGDALYLAHDRREWLLVLQAASLYTPDHVFRMIERYYASSSTDWKHLDWRIWCAEEIDEAQMQFRPPLGRKFIPVAASNYLTSSVTANGCRQDIERYSEVIYGGGYSLGEMFAAGKARTLYDADKDTFSKEPTASAFVFRMDDKVLAVSAKVFAALYELGFQITCPTECTTDSPPVLGLYKDGDIPLFGFMMPANTSGIFEDPDGRELFQDAAVASWKNPEEALRNLHQTDYRRGVTLWDLVDKGFHPARQVVSILRWKGLSDLQIEELYEAGRENSYRKQHQALLREAEELTDREIYSGMPAWRVDRLRERSKEAIHRIQNFADDLNETLDFGNWAEIRQKMREIA